MTHLADTDYVLLSSTKKNRRIVSSNVNAKISLKGYSGVSLIHGLTHHEPVSDTDR